MKKVLTKMKKVLTRTPKKMALSGSEPVFTHAPFGTDVGVKSNNCTAYAYQVYGRRPGFKLQPGDLAGLSGDFGLATCSPAVKRVLADLEARGLGYRITDPDQPCKRGYAKVMLFLDANTDYHFLRQNGDVVVDVKQGDTRGIIAKKFRVPVSHVIGRIPGKNVRVVGAGVWSHKRGTAFGPDMTNSNGKLIFDPRTSDLEYGEYEYNKFCAAFCMKQKPCPRKK